MRLRPEIPVLALAALALAGCPKRVNNALHDFAPSYEMKQPATADPALGRRLINNQPETNRCFLGDTLVMSYPGPDSVDLSYESATDAKLKADFGPIVTVGAGGGTTGAVHIILGDVTLTRLDRLFFNPAGACADTGAALATSSEQRVITRALKAARVRITWQSATSASLGLDIQQVGGSVQDSSQHDVAYAGTNIYFAHYPEKVRVTRTGVAGDTMGVGQTVDVGPCGFTLTAVQDRWNGTLSCQGGQSFNLAGNAGAYGGVNVGPGVSYSVRVRRGPGVARGTVDVWRYEVRGIM